MKENTTYISSMITIIILCVLSMFLVIYFVLYTHRLKKSIRYEKEEAELKEQAETNGTDKNIDYQKKLKKLRKRRQNDRYVFVLPFVGIIILCTVFTAGSIFSIAGIIDLEQRMNEMFENQDAQEDRLKRIDRLADENYYHIINLMRRKENTIVSSCKFTLGEYHADTHSIDTNIKVILKITPPDDTVTFYYEDQAVKMYKRDRGVYSGTFQANIYNSSLDGLLTVQTETDVVSEYVSDSSLSENDSARLNCANYVPYFEIGFDALPEEKWIVPDQRYQEKIDHENHTIQFIENWSIRLNLPAYDPDFEVDSCQLVYKLNGKTIEEQDVTENYLDGLKEYGEPYIKSVYTDKKVENFQDDDVYQIFIGVTDKNGYTYLKTLYSSIGITNRTTASPDLHDSNGDIVYVFDKDGNEIKEMARNFIRK